MLEELSVQEGYAAWAPFYDEDGNPLTALEGPVVHSLMGKLVGKSVLDLGCGTGRHTAALLDAGANSVVAIDFTPEMIERARLKMRNRPVHWLRHALPSPLPFRDATFELAVLGLVVEHIEPLTAALKEVRRVLSPGGRCIVSALHPDRTEEGQRARFIDPETGLRRPIRTFHRTTEEYIDAGRAAGLSLDSETTLVVPPELAERLPRAQPYVGRNLGWVACWSRAEQP